MEGSDEDRRRFVALPVQLVETAGGAILKRGCVEISIGGDRALPTLQILLDSMSGDGATVEEVCNSFSAPDRPAVLQLIGKLRDRQIVVSEGSELLPANGETHLDVFYWHFGRSTAEVNSRLNRVRVAILGVNCISRQLANSLAAAGMESVEVIDYPLLRNLSLYDDKGTLPPTKWSVAAQPLDYDEWAKGLNPDSFECLVATSDFGGMSLLRQWNALCLEYGRHFLPVALQDLIGYVGPSVIPGETACLECYLARLDSNGAGDTIAHPDEESIWAGQQVAGFHPSMASVLGDIAAMELTKFYSGALPLWKVGTVMEVNLLAGRIDSRKVLRVPRCRACSALLRRSSTSIVEGSLGSKVIVE